ncbi:MAG: DUF2970 domain-containing protein [Cellvibrionaceae bacterium]
MSNTQPPEEKNDSNQDLAKPTFIQVVGSTLAAAIGIQNSKNRERDFKHGNIKTFIAAGVIFTIIFVLTVSFIVKMVLKSLGA